jgi:hypothetical protein
MFPVLHRELAPLIPDALLRIDFNVIRSRKSKSSGRANRSASETPGWVEINRTEDESVFAALAHPARRRMLLTIYFNGGSMTAGEIAAIFDHAWQTTTRHLRVLETAGACSVTRSRAYAHLPNTAQTARTSEGLACSLSERQQTLSDYNMSGNASKQEIKTR